MKVFFLKITILILISIITLIGCKNLFKWILSNTFGGEASTEEQIDKSFNLALNNNYKTLIVGNSRIYRGVNPDKLTFSEAFNFGHDNDSYNQIFYKLLFLEKKKKDFSYLMLGTDYFQFSIFSDTRNYVYRKYLGQEYIKDYTSYYNWKNIDNWINSWITIQFSNTFTALTNRFKDIVLNIKPYSYLTEKGQFITIAKANSFNNNLLILPLQKHYFDKILDFCKKKHITIFIVIPPTLPEELNNYNKDALKHHEAYFKKIIEEQKGYYLNYSADQRFIGEDFADIAHLGKEGADKFSQILSQDITTILYNKLTKIEVVEKNN